MKERKEKQVDHVPGSKKVESGIYPIEQARLKETYTELA
jgi:hypothetical protein